MAELFHSYAPRTTQFSKNNWRWTNQKVSACDTTIHAVLCIIRELTINAIRHGKTAHIIIHGTLDETGVKFHLLTIFRKLNVANRTEAVGLASRKHLFQT